MPLEQDSIDVLSIFKLPLTSSNKQYEALELTEKNNKKIIKNFTF